MVRSALRRVARSRLAQWGTLAAMAGAAACSPEAGHSSERARSVIAALGEPQDGFPSWAERAVHLWVNRARSDPAADLASCAQCREKACYSPSPPQAWDHDLGRAARFHSENLVRAGCGLQHASPCTLVSGLGSLYTPGSCNGTPSCACQGGTASCGSSGTSFSARIALFDGSGSGSAENIARGSSDPVSTFYQWLHEPDASAACGFRLTNGHRYSILNPANLRLGVGQYQTTTTQDFRTGSAPTGLVAGVHYPQSGSSPAYRVHWYGTPAASLVRVNVDGVCTTLSVERGSPTNGTYLATVAGAGCRRYYFEAETNSGTTFLPTTGSWGAGCATDWEPTRAPPCGACAPSCAGRACGDDGCGGSCGACPTTFVCNTGGACVCPTNLTACAGRCRNLNVAPAHCGACGNVCSPNERCLQGVCTCQPDCTGRECGDDGCGGSCGACGAGRACSGGACVCLGATVDCAGECRDLRTDPGHCGACGAACPVGHACVAGTCAIAPPDAGCVPACDGVECGDDGCGAACGTCALGRICAAGLCACAGAQLSCAGECRDVRTDPSHCGACGRACAPSERCSTGECVADGGSGSGGAAGSAGAPGASGVGGTAGGAGEGAGGPGRAGAEPAGSGADGSEATDERSSDEASCACRTQPTLRPPLPGWILAAAMLAGRRRRRRDPTRRGPRPR